MSDGYDGYDAEAAAWIYQAVYYEERRPESGLVESLVDLLRGAYRAGAAEMRERAAAAVDEAEGHPAAGDTVRALSLTDPEPGEEVL